MTDQYRERGRAKLWPAIICGVLIVTASLLLVLAVRAARSLKADHIVANEANAMRVLKALAAAQRHFSAANIATVPGNTSAKLGDGAYSDNVRSLHYGVDRDGKGIKLISSTLADAFLTAPPFSGTAAKNEGYKTATAFQGYFFLGDPDLPQEEYGKRFAYLAVPAFYAASGQDVFWISETGKLYSADLSLAKDTPGAAIVERLRGKTPLTKQDDIRWHSSDPNDDDIPSSR